MGISSPVLSQLSSSVLTGIAAFHESRCATGTQTVKTDPMRWIVGAYLTAATTTVITKLAVYRKTSCATARKTAPMAQTRRSVVGYDGSYLKHQSDAGLFHPLMFLLQVWLPVRATSIAVPVASVCLRD